jgi:hypothetical protein
MRTEIHQEKEDYKDGEEKNLNHQPRRPPSSQRKQGK